MDPYSAGMKRSADGFDDDASKRQKVGPSPVLHVRGLPYSTTESEIVTLLAPYGQVVRTLLLQDKNQAFIQMVDLQGSTAAVQAFEYAPPTIRSKAVYFQFSSRQEIEVRNPAGGAGSIEGASCTVIIAVSNVTVPVTLDNIHQVCKPYGDVLKIITFNKNMDFQALVQFSTVEQATNAKLFLDGKDLFQGCCHLRLAFSKRQNLVVKQNDHKSRDFTGMAGAVPQSQMGGGLMSNPMSNPMNGGMNGGMNAGMAGYGGIGGVPGLGAPASMAGFGQQGPPGATSVVLVNKLDAEKVTPDVLFQLFGVYGDVLRVKILYNKRDTAMIQFATSQQAVFAQQNLNNCPLFGEQINVNKSKHTDVKLPRDNAEDGKELTRDFQGAEGHRFKKKSFINSKNVNPPSQVIHVANIHESATADELRDLFAAQQPGAPQPVVEFFKNSRSMAYIAMNSVEEAVTALINLHSWKLHGYGLRVSFSHKDPSSVVATEEQPAATA